MDDKDVLFVNWSHLPLACTQEVDGTVITVSALFGLIFLLGICGNSLVLAVLLQRKPQRLHRSTTNTFILNLSIADLLFLFLCVPFQATIYSLPSWIFGAFLCKSVHYLFTVCMLVSIFTLVTMSIERYIAVVLSHRSLLLRTPRNAQIAVLITWLLSMVTAAPLACYQNLVSGKPYGQPNCSFCWEIWPLWEPSPRRAYKTCVFVLGYLLPLILICCCYTCVLSHLYRKVRNTSRKSERSRRKTTQTVLTVVSVFCLSWLPHHIISLWVEFGSFPITPASFFMRIVSHCLVYGNSCMNPIIYAFLSENFRCAFLDLFSCAKRPSDKKLSKPPLTPHQDNSAHTTTSPC